MCTAFVFCVQYNQSLVNHAVSQFNRNAVFTGADRDIFAVKIFSPVA